MAITIAIAVPAPVPILVERRGRVAMMFMEGKREGEAIVRRLQGDDEATEMGRQSDVAPAWAS